jgi:hypothetical protein
MDETGSEIVVGVRKTSRKLQHIDSEELLTVYCPLALLLKFTDCVAFRMEKVSKHQGIHSRSEIQKGEKTFAKVNRNSE